MIRVHPRGTKNLDQARYVCVYCGGIDNDGTEYAWGRLYPESQIVKHKGKFYCTDHFRWAFKKQWEDEAPLDIKEDTSEY